MHATSTRIVACRKSFPVVFLDGVESLDSWLRIGLSVEDEMRTVRLAGLDGLDEFRVEVDYL
jgi:hypothetical protein